MPREHGPQIKDGKLYEDLLGRGESPQKAARIANAHAAGTLRHDSVHLEDRTVAELKKEAGRIGIPRRSRLRKAELVDAIRGHG